MGLNLKAPKRTAKTLIPSDLALENSQVDWVLGADEVGMGCLAGPVVAAAFAYSVKDLKDSWETPAPVRVWDSKKMTELQKEAAREYLRQHSACYWAVAEMSPAEIDALNILRASQKALWRACSQVMSILSERKLLEPGMRAWILIDGNKIPVEFRQAPVPWKVCSIVKGDAQSFPIAAASIFAKLHRDHRMKELASEYPGYGWNSNVGYPTLEHKKAIAAQGPTPHHRRSFRWDLPESLSV